MIRRSVISGMLAFLILIGSIFCWFNSVALAETVQLTAEQRNAIAMLNHIIVPLLFETQPWTYPILVQDMEDIKTEAEKILFVTGGIRTQEQFDEYQQCAEKLFQKLSEQIPSLLRNVDFFSDVFYK